jgi:uncharacterized protein (TIRG00374 family)
MVAFACVAAIGDSEKLRSALARVDSSLFLSLIGLALLNYLLRAVRFQLFARRIGVKVPFPWMFLYYVAGFAMSATPGKIGELLRLWLIRRRYGYSIEHCMPLQIVDRACDVVASLALCIAAIGVFSSYSTFVFFGAAVSVLGTVMLAYPVFLLALINVAYKTLARWGRPLARLRRIVRKTSTLFTPRIFLIALGLSALGWGAECVAFDICIQAISGAGNLTRATFIYTFANLIGGISFLPGGVGSTELSMAGLLVASGTMLEDAVTATAIIRVGTLWFGLVIGMGATLTILRLGKTKSSESNAGLIGSL